jgi:hypothetical protein
MRCNGDIYYHDIGTRIRIVNSPGGTSLEGHITAPYGGLCIDLSRMDKILELNRECSPGNLLFYPPLLPVLRSAWGICAASFHGKSNDSHVNPFTRG